jgi:guanine nucleotide-binding protein G(I)/G(S)/G(T) subunit beta-1
VTDFNSSKGVQLVNIRCRSTLKGHLSKIYCVDWCHDNTHVVSASQDGRLIVWNAQTTYKLHAIPLTSNWVMTCAYSPSGSMVACGGLDNTCSIYNIQGKDNSENADIKVTKQLSAHNGYLSGCQFITDKNIVTSSGDQTCILWDTELGQVTRKFSGHTGDVMCVHISPDHNTFVSGSCDKTARIWDIRTGDCVQTISGHHTSDINSVKYFPNGMLIGTGSDDQSCSLFDVRANQTLTTYSDDTVVKEPVTSMAFSKSGRVMFAAYEDNKIIAWDTMKSKPLKILTGHQNCVSCVAVSPSGCALVSSSWDTSLKVWSI